MNVADVVIVGAGMAGVSLAAELAPYRKVIVLETEAMPGYHATGRSAAIFVPNYGDEPVRELSRGSRAHFDAPEPEFWPTPLLTRRGLLRLVRAEGQAEYRAQMEGAAGVEPITVAKACEIFPVLRPERFVEASWEEDVHDIDVDALLQGYLRKARSHGARIETNRPVTAIRFETSGWSVTAGGEEYSAGILVNAAGAWADRVAGLAGVTPAGLVPQRRSVAVIPLPPELEATSASPFVVPFPLGWYAKREAGRLFVSAAEEHAADPHDAWADDLVLAEGLDRFMRDTTVEVQQLHSSWAGLRTFAPGGLPVVGFDREAEGFFWLAGQGGFGIQTAPALAARATSFMLAR
jgi:D-arginine dehydrogenase